MIEKKETIKKGENVSISENIIVINDLSVAEKKEFNQEEPIIPTTTLDVLPKSDELEVSENNFSNDTEENKDVSDITITQNINSEIPKISETEDKNDFPQIPIESELFTIPKSNVEIEIPDYSQLESNLNVGDSNTYNFGYSNNSNEQNILKNNDESNFIVSGVYKSSKDVDLAKNSFLKDVEKAYDKNISTPTKTLVELLNDFKKWGNDVTSQGLNRPLFEKFDELSARYDGMKVALYNDDSVNSFDFDSSSYKDDDNNYGGMVA